MFAAQAASGPSTWEILTSVPSLVQTAIAIAVGIFALVEHTKASERKEIHERPLRELASAEAGALAGIKADARRIVANGKAAIDALKEPNVAACRPPIDRLIAIAHSIRTACDGRLGQTQKLRS